MCRKNPVLPLKAYRKGYPIGNEAKILLGIPSQITINSEMKKTKRQPMPHEWWDLGIHPITGFQKGSKIARMLSYTGEKNENLKTNN